MAPVLKTYGKKKTRKKVEKEDTFDKLFKQNSTTQRSNIFESSSEREKSQPNNGEKSDVSIEKGKTTCCCSSILSPSLKTQSKNDTEESVFLTADVLDISDLTPYSLSVKRIFQKYTKFSKVHKSRGSSKKKKILPQVKKDLTNSDLFCLVSSTPKFLPLGQESMISAMGRNVSPIETSVMFNQQPPEKTDSPKGFKKLGKLTPKNILNPSNSESYLNKTTDFSMLSSMAPTEDQSLEENFYGFPSVSDESHFRKLDFYGFPSISDESHFRKLEFIEALKPSTPSTKGGPTEIDIKNGTESLVLKTSREMKEVNQCHAAPEASFNPNIFKRPDIYSHNDSLSRSMQNLNILSESDNRIIIKSSSFEEIKTEAEYKNPAVCKINIQSVPTDQNVDSSDMEESAVNSADERSCSIRSCQLDEEESAFHSSDEENVSGYSKDKDSVDFTNQKSSSKGDSESAIFSGPTRDVSGNNQSEEASADDCDLYTESEIAKSSDSIEVSRTANNEVASSDLSTSSDKDILKEDDVGTAVVHNLNISDKMDHLKQNINHQGTRTFSVKSKDSSCCSMENSASDESELSFESDSELSCESSRSSRKSSLESAITLSKEALEQLRESISLIKVQDEYEDALCYRTRKTLTKRSSEWECPPSPRRSLFPLAPLFPLPENQEDPSLDDPAEGHGSGSLCDSTASEEDSHHSGNRKSRGKPKDSIFRKRDESGIEGRSSGEDESTKSSPVRETNRLRRSRRISRKSRESDSRLNMVIEESDSESTEADIVPQMEHIILPTGKKYRRSLSIIKHLGDESFQVPANKGRHFDQSVESVIKLQSKTGFQSPRDGRRSLLIKRRSLLSQCYTPCASPAAGISQGSIDLFTSILAEGSPLTSRRSIRKLSYLKTVGSLENSVSKLALTSSNNLIKEEENEEFVDIDTSVERKEKIEYESEEASKNEENDDTFISESGYSNNEECQVPTNIIVNYEELVFRVCQQSKPFPFSKILYGDWFEGSTKVGEGVYGEVFMIPRDNCKNVLKIIPIEGSILVNQEKQKTFAEISNELLIASTLSDLRDENEEFMTSGFAELIDASVIKGCYPKKLIQLWNEFDETKGGGNEICSSIKNKFLPNLPTNVDESIYENTSIGSDNDSPTIFGKDQLYLVLELGNAGTDLESYSFSTAKQGLSVFKQTVCALAVAEAVHEFEHRDLHWGNVLVSRTSERDIPFTLNKEKYTILTNGVKATIIDFTLSRISLSCFPVYYDIGQDPDMFIGSGDYQFDIYRHMKEDVQNKWNSFVPKTNVRWLHYLVDKMISKVRYQRKTAKVHTDSMKILKEIESWILSCDNAVQVALRVVQYK